MDNVIETLYYEAKAADEVFQASVVKQFGLKNAGDMRYQSKKHNPETREAGLKMQNATDQYLAACRAARKSA